MRPYLIGLLFIGLGLSASRAQDLRGQARDGATPPPAEGTGLERFDFQKIDLHWIGKHWVLTAGEVVLKDFGRDQTGAREALRLIRELRLSQRGTIGTPRPVIEYWLAEGQAPQGPIRGVTGLAFDPESLRVEAVEGLWCLRDARQILFSFGTKAEEARQAEAILRKFGFNQVIYLGHPAPVMMVFLANAARPAAGIAKSTRPVEKVAGNSALMTPASRGGAATAGVAQRLPLGHQLAAPNLNPATLGGNEQLMPLDWQQVSLRRDGPDWNLIHAGTILATFGTHEREARQALEAVHFYRFTERCVIGTGQSSVAYYLVYGQAPRGLRFGVDQVPFRAANLAVHRHGSNYFLADGPRAIIYCGSAEADALQLLADIRRHGFDCLCRIGPGDRPAFTFFVRAR